MANARLAGTVELGRPSRRGREVRPRLLRLLDDLTLYGASILAALIINALLLRLVGADPVAAYARILRVSLGSTSGFAQTLDRTTPLLLGAVAVSLGLRAGYTNLGVDGQIYLGAIAATGVAFALPRAPGPLLQAALLLGATLGGGALALIPAFLRARRGINELFVTVMLNFIGLYLIDYLTTGPWADPVAGEAISRPIAPSARLHHLLGSTGHIGILIAVAIAAGVAVWLGRTRRGFELRASGLNPQATRYGGVALVTTGVLALVVSGAIAGLAGGIEIAGVHGRLVKGISPSYGYMAVLIAVLARRNCYGAIAVAFAFAVLIVGSDSLQRSVKLPQSAVLVFQAVVVLAVLFFESLRRRYPRLLMWSGVPA